RRVGAGAARLRPAARARATRARADAARATGLARHVLRLARAVGLRFRPPPPDDRAPRRAFDVPRCGRTLLVARRARPGRVGGEGAVPLRRVRAGEPAGTAARAAAAPGLFVLRARASPLGAEPARRSAARGRDDGVGAGCCDLRLPAHPRAPLPEGGGGGGCLRAAPRGSPA